MYLWWHVCGWFYLCDVIIQGAVPIASYRWVAFHIIKKKCCVSICAVVCLMKSIHVSATELGHIIDHFVNIIAHINSKLISMCVLEISHTNVLIRIHTNHIMHFIENNY